jgi:serine/threonine protein kinase
MTYGTTLDAMSTGRSVLVRDGDGVVAVMHTLDFDTIADMGFQQAYPREAAVLAGVDNTRIACPRSYVVAAGGWIVASVRGYVSGVDLATMLAGYPRGMDVQTAAVITRDVLIGLAALHRLGVAHHTVGAERVMVGADGICVLVEVGVAPRVAGRGWEGDVAADLRAVAELFAACLTGRRAPAREPAHREQSATRPAVGAALVDYLCTLLTGIGLMHIPAEDRAFSVLVELEAAVADHFEAGWDERSRDRLAAQVAAMPPAELPMVGSAA